MRIHVWSPRGRSQAVDGSAVAGGGWEVLPWGGRKSPTVPQSTLRTPHRPVGAHLSPVERGRVSSLLHSQFWSPQCQCKPAEGEITSWTLLCLVNWTSPSPDQLIRVSWKKIQIVLFFSLKLCPLMVNTKLFSVVFPVYLIRRVSSLSMKKYFTRKKVFSWYLTIFRTSPVWSGGEIER